MTRAERRPAAAWVVLPVAGRAREIAQVFAVVVGVHLPVNVVGYAIGARTSPI